MPYSKEQLINAVNEFYYIEENMIKSFNDFLQKTKSEDVNFLSKEEAEEIKNIIATLLKDTNKHTQLLQRISN